MGKAIHIAHFIYGRTLVILNQMLFPETRCESSFVEKEMQHDTYDNMFFLYFVGVFLSSLSFIKNS